MNDKTPHEPTDDAFARLQAADPAANIEPSAGFADRVIAEASAAPEVVTLATERERRRPLWQTLVGAAAAIAIVGGTGFGIGASGVGSPVASTAESESSIAPPISLGNPGNPTQFQSGTDSAPLVGESAVGSKISDRMYPGFFGGRNVFTSSGLNTESGTALAYGFDPSSASTAEQVGALAAVLGVEGTPEIRDGAWMVGVNDGGTPTVSVALDGTLSFNYWNPTINPYGACDAEGVCAPADAPPGDESALATARDLFERLGYDLNDLAITSQTWAESPLSQVTASRIVDGQQTDQTLYVGIALGGIMEVHGQLAPIVELGEYAIVSEQGAFERLSDTRFGAFMSNPILFQNNTVIDDVQEYVPPTEPPATPVPGTSVSWPVNNVNIVSARLGLASQYQPDGTALILPAYEFTDSNGGTWSVIAVDDSQLDFSTE